MPPSPADLDVPARGGDAPARGGGRADRRVGRCVLVCALLGVLGAIGFGIPGAHGATTDPSRTGVPAQPTPGGGSTPGSGSTPGGGSRPGSGSAAHPDPPETRVRESVRGIEAAGSTLAIDVADAVRPLRAEQRRDGRITITISSDVLFAFDSPDVTEVARAEIARVATLVPPGTDTVRVIGFTDSLGTPAHNVMLSQRRADAVAKLLRSSISNEIRVSATGRASADPVAPNTNTDGSDNPDGRALNRRVQITIPTS